MMPDEKNKGPERDEQGKWIKDADKGLKRYLHINVTNWMCTLDPGRRRTDPETGEMTETPARFVEFEPLGDLYEAGYYETRDAEEIKVIEASSDFFGREIRVVKSREDAELEYLRHERDKKSREVNVMADEEGRKEVAK